MQTRPIESIHIDRDPALALREAHDAAEYASMHTSQFSRKNLQRIEMAVSLMKRAMEESE